MVDDEQMRGLGLGVRFQIKVAQGAGAAVTTAFRRAGGRVGADALPDGAFGRRVERDFGDVAKLDPPQWNDSRTFRRVYYYYYSSQVSVTTSTSLMEQGISRFNVLLREMPRRGYLAVADEPLETPVGAEAREKQPDVNFVIGAW